MSKKSEKISEILSKENLIQAVVIADNFNKAFTPATDDTPLALLPLVNVPLIDYTLECLALGGVEEVFLFCSSHVDKIRQYIKKQIDENMYSYVSMSIQIIVSESCRSFGDAMRDLDAKGLLRSDFVLLSANTVANIQFIPLLKNHKANCKKDKGCSMTLIFKEALPGQSGRCPQEEVFLATNKETNKVLYHQKIGAEPFSTKIEIALDTLLECPRIDLRYDLQDTQIVICSPSVLPLFSDNFDFQTRDDLIRGLLNDEIIENTIYWCSVTDYAASVTNWHMYQTVSYDIIHRYTYPFVTDIMLRKEGKPYMYLRNNIYRNKNVTLSKGSNLIEDVVLAEGSKIGEFSKIDRSIIGANCKIGKNVTIVDSFIMDAVTIGDNSVISLSVVGKNSIIKNNVKLSDSCVLGPNVQIEQGKILEAVLIQSKIPENSNKDDIINKKAYRVRSYSERKDDSDSEIGDLKFTSRLRKQSETLNESSDEEDEESLESGSEMSHMASPAPDDTNLFLSEVIDSLARGYEDKLACDNLILEINSSRYAYNITLKEVNYNVLKAMLSLPFQQKTEKPYYQSLHSLLTYFLPILKNYVKNKTAMYDCLQAIEDSASTCTELIKCVAKVIHWFYDNDILSENVIVDWHVKLNQKSRIYTQVQPFINWLEEADEESSESE